MPTQNQVDAAVYEQERQDIIRQMHELNNRLCELNHLIYQLKYHKESKDGH